MSKDKKYPIPVMAIMLTTLDGRILLGKRTKQSSPWWGVPGGKIEWGENLFETACRELEEEFPSSHS